MRIVAGQFRGRAIQAPASNNTRPTIDRVREALFSSLYSLRGSFEEAVVLDAFAGSGALGLEALSRGARKVVFYEKDKSALETLKRNIETLHVRESVRVCSSDIFKRPPTSAEGPFDVVFFDPPYKTSIEEVLSLLQDLREAKALLPNALIAYEHGAQAADEVERAATVAGFQVISQKKYGKTRMTLLKED